MPEGSASGQLFTMLLPLILLWLPLIFLNAFIAKRKGRNPIAFGFLSILPVVGFYLSIYLISLTDMQVIEMLKKIAKKVGAEDQKAVGS